MNKTLRLFAKRILQHFYAALAGRGFIRATIKFNGYSRIKANVTFGENVNFNGVRITGSGHVYIGNNFHSGEGLAILTQNHNYRGTALPYDETIITKDVRIEDNVWVGMNVLILPGVTIGEGAIIQAGSVVSSSIPSLGIAGGNPAKTFSFRDEEHYFQLKAKGHFH